MPEKVGNINAPVPHRFQEYPKHVNGGIANSPAEETALRSKPSSADLDAVAEEQKAAGATSGPSWKLVNGKWELA
jgi:hypothetical protein